MSNPHPILSQIYGTSQTEEDLEKTASVEALVKLAAENGAELDDETLAEIEDLSTEQIHELIGDMVGDDDGSEDADGEWNQKVAEADMLGRVMAHSFYQESGSIEKTAGMGSKVFKALKGAATARGFRGGRKTIKALGAGSKHEGRILTATEKAHTRNALTKAESRMRRGAAATAGLYGGGATVAGGSLAAALGGRRKKESSVDDVILARAQEIMQAYGLEKVADGQDELDFAALQLLEQEGFDLSSIVGE